MLVVLAQTFQGGLKEADPWGSEAGKQHSSVLSSFFSVTLEKPELEMLLSPPFLVRGGSP